MTERAISNLAGFFVLGLVVTGYVLNVLRFSGVA